LNISGQIAESMRGFYGSLSEKDQRRYAAVEAIKLGHGGKSMIKKLLGIDYKTLVRGKEEIHNKEILLQKNIRKRGCGRKRVIENTEGIDAAFLRVTEEHVAGSPMDEKIKWTNLSRGEISERLAEEKIKVSVTVVDQLLEKHDFRRRKAFKSLPGGHAKNRNKQFINIQRLISEFKEAGNPVLSMDTKKKELLGNFYRDGKLYTTEQLRVFDHDFPSQADGVVIPHGLFDLFRNTGYMTIGTSHDTSEFACDCIRHWWYQYGMIDYSQATAIMLLCDCGGSNNARYYVFKEQLQKLANEIGISIRITHYPPYTSKYNPIEHRLFPHITRACKGMIFKNNELVKNLMARATTKKGLRVFANILDKAFQTGKKVEGGFKENMKIVFDDVLPKVELYSDTFKQIKLGSY